MATEPQKFSLAILDHLPVFTDQLAAARKQYEALTAAGMKATPVWKQVLSSIVSWQTAMTVGIMLSVTYGKEIGEWVKGLFSAKKGVRCREARGRGVPQRDGPRDASRRRRRLRSSTSLYRVATDAKRPYEERRNAAVQKLQEVYPAYFGNLSTEQIMVGAHSTSTMTSALRSFATAEARAAADAVTENQKQLTLLPDRRETLTIVTAKRSQTSQTQKEVQGCRQAVRNVPYDRWPDRNDARTDCARQC